jgi:hypothetical protein
MMAAAMIDALSATHALPMIHALPPMAISYTFRRRMSSGLRMGAAKGWMLPC